MGRKLGVAVAAAIVAGWAIQPAGAAMTTLEFDGHLSLVLENEADDSDRLRLYVGNLHTDEPIRVSVEIDEAAGTMDFTGAGVGLIYPFDSYLTGDPPVFPDEIDVTFQMSYTGVVFGTDPVTGLDVFAIGRQPDSGSGSVTLDNTNLFGDAVTLELLSKPVEAKPNGKHSVWGQFAVQEFSLFAGEVPGVNWNLDFRNALSAWVMGSEPLFIGGNSYAIVAGDIHARIPEPASIGLFATAAAAYAGRRRRR